MKSAGLYFGPKNTCLIEASGKQITNIIQFPVPKSDSNVLDDKALEDLKVGMTLKEELKKNPFDVRNVNVVIPGKDFVIRTFHMPVLAASELSEAVRFEARKYIPFKVDELVADYRFIYDKSNKKNLVLFVGIKKDILDRYIGILTQCNLKADSVEYAGFSAARLLLQSNIKEREAVAVVYADPVEDDEVNFVVLEDGFPLFSRDIFLSGYSEEGGVKVEKLAMVDKMDKLKVEVRVSLDFYLRKFPTRNIKKIIFITPPDFRGELEAFVKERTLSCRFVELGTLVDRPGVFPLGFYKAYAASLAKVVIPKIKVDLLSVTMAPKKALRPKTGHAFTPVPLKFKPKYAIWGALICAAAFGWGVFQRMPVQRDLDMILSMQPRVAAVGLQASLDEVNAKNSEYAEKIRNIDAVVHKRFMLTSELDIIPRIIPEGVWLRDFSFRQDNKNLEFIMTGWAYLKDSNKELEAINMFLTRLKEDKKFGPVFTDISITGVNQGQYRNAPVTSFMIVCKGRR